MSRSNDLATTSPTVVSDKPNTSTGYLDLPSGTTAQRPTLDNAGGTRFNTTLGSLEFYDGANWVSTNLIPTINSITGTIYAGVSSTLTLSVANATDTIDVKYYEGNTLLAIDTNRTVTSGSATSTVPSAVYGQTAGDTISIQVLNADGTPSSNSIDKIIIGLPTGGTNADGTSRAVVTSGGYRYHAFLSSATNGFVVPSGFSATAEYLIIAGGGGSADHNTQTATGGGGGGAGGVLSGTQTLSGLASYTIVVGGGGSRMANGDNSIAFSQTAIGGGMGGARDGTGGTASTSGGSGGGAGYDDTSSGSGTSGQGSDGGTVGSSYGGGGGGGKGGDGGNGTGSSASSVGGTSGAGTNSFSTWASATSTGDGGYFASGGSGASGDGTTTQSTQLSGGGGRGGAGGGTGVTHIAPTNGSVNTGGGAGGAAPIGSGNTGYGAMGGSGIVIIRYQLPA